jgi:chemotaxis protein CheX
MQAVHINPFLQSAALVLEQMCAVAPERGELSVRIIEFKDNYVWLQIGLLGQMNGDIVFGFPEVVALRIVSGMMGGYVVTEFDEMSQSALSELGNMITGNASSILYNEGIRIDITPPMIIDVNNRSHIFTRRKAIVVPLRLANIGEFEIYIVAS